MTSSTLLIIVAAIVVVLAVMAFAVLLQRNRRTDKLKSKFGEEYNRTIESSGSRREAEADLSDRVKRVEHFEIRPLGTTDRDDFVESWRHVQAEFVDDPRDAVAHADDLLGKVMSTRGYPMGDFDQRAADISVDHPHVVENYRAGHEIALRHADGQASTEDLRQAMIHYKSLFDELVGETEPARAPS